MATQAATLEYYTEKNSKTVMIVEGKTIMPFGIATVIRIKNKIK